MGAEGEAGDNVRANIKETQKQVFNHVFDPSDAQRVKSWTKAFSMQLLDVAQIGGLNYMILYLVYIYC